ncbi:MAG TPA: DegT/DnrJ/EryC1/StrS family aminotransferase, partial [Candidatus Krumholzibacteria bacterium]|nr:DegT/DnrJ/EryC1/StrS family aminotransferase [Candidatus Krumholzibacteria bacterium]
DAVLPGYAQPAWRTAALLELQHLAFRVLGHPRLFWGVQGLYRALGRMGLVIGSSTGDELSCALPGDYARAMHPLQQRRLGRLLDGLEAMIAERRRNTALIETALREAGLPTAAVPAGCDPVILRYPVPVENKAALLAAARQKQVRLGDWFLSPVHPNLAGWELAGYAAGTCPVAESLSRRVINIPTDGRQTAREIRRTVDFLARHGQWARTA